MLFPPVEQANGSQQHIDSNGNGTQCLGHIHFEIADKQMILIISTKHASAFSPLHFSSLHLWVCSRRTPWLDRPPLHFTQPDGFESHTLHPPVFLHKAVLGPFYLVNSLLFTLSVVLGCEYSALSDFLITPFVCLFFLQNISALIAGSTQAKQPGGPTYLDMSRNKNVSVSIKSNLV